MARGRRRVRRRGGGGRVPSVGLGGPARAVDLVLVNSCRHEYLHE